MPDKKRNEPEFEWGALEPSDKRVGCTRFVLDDDLAITAEGVVYGIGHKSKGDGFESGFFFDHYNRRLRILDHRVADHSLFAAHVEKLCRANGYTKTFVKSRQKDAEGFSAAGYRTEGRIAGFYSGEDAVILARYFDDERSRSVDGKKADEILREVFQAPRYDRWQSREGQSLEIATPDDIPELTALYREVFRTYPSPMAFPDYLRYAMENDTLFYVVREDGKILAAASADMDPIHGNAEMTDCATLPDARGGGLMTGILQSLEEHLANRSVGCAYTLCRATSYGMNKVFARLGYGYSGRLIKNCDIAGRFEDMNIWVKSTIDPKS